MMLKKVGTSLLCTITMFLLCSTYSYAAVNDSNMQSEATQSLTNFEQSISQEKSDFNLNDSDDIQNNLELGKVYPNNIVEINNSGGTKLSEKVKKTNEYVATVKLKDSDKPFALAYIKNENSKWVIYRLNSYNLLDDEIKNYQKDTNTNDEPTVIIDESNNIYAVGSDKSGDKIKIIQPSRQLDLKKGNFEKVTNLQSKLKVMHSNNMKTTTGASAELDGGSGGDSVNKFNYAYLIIPISFLLYAAIFFTITKKRSKCNKAQ